MKVVITGANGMLASSVRAEWDAQRPDDQVVGLSRSDVDLRDRDATRAVLEKIRPDAVIHCAARVGGIAANVANPTGFLLDNLLLDSSVIGNSIELGVDKFVYVGSSCMYPRDYRQPLVESDILAAPLEPTNEGYAIAKIAGSKLCEYASRELGLTYRTIIPSNLYGPKDDYNSGRSHLIAAAVSKVHAAKTAHSPAVEIWGDGTARREFTYVGDLANWLVAEIDRLGDWPSVLNVGCGYDRTVSEFYQLAKEVVGYEGGFVYDTTKPTGMHQKLMDSSAAKHLGWAPRTSLEDGIRHAYEVFLADSLPATQSGI
ncbi:MAG: NAD-dependent epimerase/dehydratase family protein [Galbitalea sp.]